MSTLQERFQAEFFQLLMNSEPVVIHLDRIRAWVVFSNLQLALRHPKNIGPSAEITLEIAQGLEKLLAITPALKEVAALGWGEDGHENAIQ